MLDKELLFGTIIMFIIIIIFGSLIFWGIGNLIILIFKVNYVWTIWHGFIVELIYIILKEIFGGK